MKKNLMLSLLTAVIVVNSANASDSKAEFAELRKLIAEQSTVISQISKTISKSKRGFPFRLLFATAGTGIGVGYIYHNEIEANRQKCITAGRQFLAQGVKLVSEQTLTKPAEITSTASDAPRAAVEASAEQTTTPAKSEDDKS